ncbi:MAG: tryptophan 2,3-dioxygenase family protein, partial [Flavobacteriaceae bacterium]
LDFFLEKVRRINSYYQALISSFSIMIKGMEREQFLQYRMALLPASGFQSVQYRMIEIYATPLENLVHHTDRGRFTSEDSIDDLYERIYWKKGATDITSGEKTLTLKQFEYRYTPRLIRIANQVKNGTICDKYLQLGSEKRDNKELINALKTLDLNANVNWPLMHMGSAHRYLAKDKEQIGATGGTNWKEYLPPSFQKVIFFPDLYTKEELNNWGKQWVDHIFNPDNVLKK